jgi:hypothetical protein
VLVAPASAAVRLSLSLPLQPFYLNVVLTEKTPLTSLLSTIVGLAGIFSLFGTLLGVTDTVQKFAPKRCGGGARPAPESDGSFSMSNPLARVPAAAPPATTLTKPPEAASAMALAHPALVLAHPSEAAPKSVPMAAPKAALGAAPVPRGAADEATRREAFADVAREAEALIAIAAAEGPFFLGAGVADVFLAPPGDAGQREAGLSPPLARSFRSKLRRPSGGP